MTDKLTAYENALRGIASCATVCEGCRMLAGIAKRVIEEQTSDVDLTPQAEALIEKHVCWECD